MKSQPPAQREIRVRFVKATRGRVSPERREAALDELMHRLVAGVIRELMEERRASLPPALDNPACEPDKAPGDPYPDE